eukprot:TRINITY_DN12930_c0_g1_i1.p1 TRINITY_DN12930_c0_g1~~TRINITY_DN12930_c0_g1_i1.p1  ORF type:complete len:635 (+),score=159.38 TRINITY_DN12930_c0_g1_i1:133-2037(+)
MGSLVPRVLLLLGLVVFAAAFSRNGHKCKHAEIAAKYKPKIVDIPGVQNFTAEELSVEAEYKRRALQAGTFRPIKITWDPTYMGSMPTEMRNFILNDLVPQMDRLFKSFLSVKPLGKNLTLTPGDCSEVKIPDRYTSGGVDSDIVIFVTTTNEPADGNGGGTLAWAASCQQGSQINNRPIAGRLNFNQVFVKTAKDQFIDQLGTAVHELLHILVMSPELMKTMVDSTGKAYGEDAVKTMNIRGVDTTVVTIPKVVTWVRDYFGCQSLPGAELENEGGSGSKGSHWETRVFLGELMTAQGTDLSVFSGITFALMDGSGWFAVDYSKAEPYNWAKGQGCDYINKNCVASGKAGYEGWCTTYGSNGCTWNSISKGTCATESGSPSISAFDYLGGKKAQDPFSDNCPYFYKDSDGRCSNSSARATNTQSYDETFAPGARCFSGDYIKSSAGTYKQGEIHNACHSWSCGKDGSGNWVLTVNVGTTQVACPSAGGTTSISGYQGTINCPPAKRFCEEDTANSCSDNNFCNSIGKCFGGACYCPSSLSPTNCGVPSFDCSTFKCNNHGTCANGKCTCTDGWGAADCSQQVTVLNCARCGANKACYGDDCEDIGELANAPGKKSGSRLFAIIALVSAFLFLL